MAKKLDRTGEVRRMNNGMMAKIIVYRNCNDIDIQFKDGTIVYHKLYDMFKKGHIANPNYNELQIHRLGEEHKMNNGQMAKIITYRTAMNIDIQFEDGTIVYHKSYDMFKKGHIANPNYNGLQIHRLGEEHKMNNGQMAKIIAYRSCRDIDIQFEDGTIIYHKLYSCFKKGEIRNPNYKIQDIRLGETRQMNNGMMATIIAYRSYTDIDVQFKNGTIVCNKSYNNFKNGRVGNPNYKIKNIKIKNYHLGEIQRMNNGQMATIIVYRSYRDIDVQFEDGTIVYHKLYRCFKKGEIRNPNYNYSKLQNSRLGEIRRMNNGMMARIIAYHSCSDMDVQFEDGTIVYHKTYDAFKKCAIANPNYKLMNGVSTNELICTFYLKQIGFKKKKNMLELNGKELDLYHSNLNGCKIGIEYDGFKHTKKKDLEKNRLCKQNNIQLYRIREGYLSKLNSTSVDFTLSDYKPKSKDLEHILQLLIKKISFNCNISIPLSIDFQRDTKQINKFLEKYHNKHEKDRLLETKKMNNGQIAKIIVYRNYMDIDVQFEDGIWGAGGLRYGVPSAAQPRRAFAGNAETDRLRPELAGLQGAGGGRNCTGGRRRRYDRRGICGGWL